MPNLDDVDIAIVSVLIVACWAMSTVPEPIPLVTTAITGIVALARGKTKE